MKKILFVAAAAILASLQPAYTQEPATSAPPVLPAPAASIGVENAATQKSIFANECPVTTYKCWASADYLLYWVKNAPSNFPLLTTTTSVASTAAGVPPGALGRPDTEVLFGGSNFNFGAFSGAQLTIGTWLDSENSIGIEATGFLLAQRSINYSAQSGANGTPQLYVPYFNSSTGKEGSLTLSEPASGLGTAGGIDYRTTLQLWGTELNSAFTLYQTATSRVTLLAGFRYVNLAESLSATANDNYFNPPPQTDFYTMNFSTLNEFYGAQLGLRGFWNFGRLTAEITGKVALGATYQSVHIDGTDTITVPGFSGTFPGFAYAMPTNIGHESRFGFSVIPEVSLKVGYNITPKLRATVGYDFLYWSNVVRPGDQMDRTINPTQVIGNPLVGPATPVRMFQTTDFFANGLNFGLELKF